MKYLALLILLASCQPKQTTKVVTIKDTVFVHDTLVKTNIYIDTVFVECPKKRELDSLKEKVFVAEYKLQRISKFVRICTANPSQDKFLKGWITRALK